MSNDMIIDLAKYASERKLLSGRENGKAAWEKIKPSQFEPSMRIIIKNDGNTLITNSYFLGMLSDIFSYYKTKSLLLDHIDFRELNDTNKQELLRGINRGFSKAVNAMG